MYIRFRNIAISIIVAFLLPSSLHGKVLAKALVNDSFIGEYVSFVFFIPKIDDKSKKYIVFSSSIENSIKEGSLEKNEKFFLEKFTFQDVGKNNVGIAILSDKNEIIDLSFDSVNIKKYHLSNSIVNSLNISFGSIIAIIVFITQQLVLNKINNNKNRMLLLSNILFFIENILYEISLNKFTPNDIIIDDYWKNEWSKIFFIDEEIIAIVFTIKNNISKKKLGELTDYDFAIIMRQIRDKLVKKMS